MSDVAKSGLPAPLRSRYVFLVKPGPSASAHWPSSLASDWLYTPQLLSWCSLMSSPGIVASTEMGVDVPTPKLPDTPVHVGPNALEIDLDIQVVCLTMSGGARDPPATAGFLMAPRSSISKSGLRPANGVSVIDPTYRGNLRARFDVDESHRGVSPGQSLLQVLTPDGGGANFIVVGNDAPVCIRAMFDTASTTRGAGAFGSTGAAGTTGGAGAGGGAGAAS